MSLDLILQDVELSDNTLNDNTFDVFYNLDTKRIHAFENDTDEPREFVYRLTDDEDIIAKKHRQEILEYCLGVDMPFWDVEIRDIFIHGKYVELVN